MSSARHTVFATVLLSAALALLPSARMDLHARADDGDGETPASEILDEDFVIASLLVSDPGSILYSRLGHAAIRMRCPQHGLDYVFTYEAENLAERPFAFLSGKLRMGMAALNPEEYMEQHSVQGRGLREYALNLPVEVKRELWRTLDDHLMEGMDLSYDYLSRGCAQSAVMMLVAGTTAGGSTMKFGAFPEYFEGASRREITYHHLKDDKWTTFLLHFIVNGVIDDTSCTNLQKLIIPADLPFVLQHATVDGRPLIDSWPQVLVPSAEQSRPGWFSPPAAAALLLLLVVVCAFLRTPVMDYLLLAVQTLLGIVAVWLLCFSTLVCTEWSWLIIPFNPLPLLFWKWRRHWCLPYAAVLLVWSGFMFFWPHLLTDSAYIVLTLAFAASYIDIHIKSQKLIHDNE